MAKNESFVYVGDHLRKANDLLNHEFWVIHARLLENYPSRADQLVDIAKLAELGTMMAQIGKARSLL